MLKRNIVLLFVFVAIVGSVNAQVRPGIKAGFNLSNVFAGYVVTPEEGAEKAGDPDNFKMKPGFQIGMVFDCTVNDKFAVQPGVRLSMLGFKDRYQSGGEVIRKFSLFYLQIPVYAQYKYRLGAVNLVGQAGPYLGYGLFGRQAYSRKDKSVTLDDNYKKITFGNGTADDVYNAFDYGVGLGLGVEYGGLQLMIGYDRGLYKMTFDKQAYSGTYNVNMRNGSFSATLAFIFGKKAPVQYED